eukprot:1509490-Alexandrium_andersonii.AAC.1
MASPRNNLPSACATPFRSSSAPRQTKWFRGVRARVSEAPARGSGNAPGESKERYLICWCRLPTACYSGGGGHPQSERRDPGPFSTLVHVLRCTLEQPQQRVVVLGVNQAEHA